MRILFIEDDVALQEIVSKRLKYEGYIVTSCFDGAAGLERATSEDFDCIILDLMLPKLDGLQLLAQLRAAGNRAKVLILTARGSVADRVEGLNAGADDYLVKPFVFEELLARIRALMRRDEDIKDNRLTVDDLVLDVSEHRVSRGGADISLTSKEYALLEYLMRNLGRIMTRSQIIDHVWGFEFEHDSNIIDVYIRYLRRKIDADHEKKLIQTVRGFGYVIKDVDQ